MVKDGLFNVQLYSVQSNPLNSNEFCIGGRSQAVKIYDRRKVSAPLYELCPNDLVYFLYSTLLKIELYCLLLSMSNFF